MVQGSIMPLAVGRHLAAKAGVRVRVIDMSDPGTPVAFAVGRDNFALKERMDQMLAVLLDEQAIQALYRARFDSDSGVLANP